MFNLDLGNLIAHLDMNTSRWDKALDKVQLKMKYTAAKLDSIGKSMTLKVTTPILAIGAASLKTATSLETAFIGVRKTVNATEKEFQALKSGFDEISTRIPLATEELYGLGEAAGQLGIRNESILSFSETMANLGATTNLSSQEAATALARFANITQMSQKNFDRLGSSIVDLGNNFATTEAEIVTMALRMASAANLAKMSEADTLAMATAFTSVGVEAQRGGTAFQKVVQNMIQAVAENNKQLEIFAKTAGQSADEFAKVFREDATKAFQLFVEGLGKSGDKAFTVLGKLGLQDQRLMQAFTSLANAGDLLSRTIDLSTNAWEENTALTEEAEKRYKSMASQFRLIWNNIKLAIEPIGKIVAKILLDLYEKRIKPLVEWFKNLDETVQENIVRFALYAAAIGPVIILVGKLTTAFTLLTLALETNPLLVAVTALTLVATALTLFSSRATAATRKAKEMKRYLADLGSETIAMKEAQKKLNTALKEGNKIMEEQAMREQLQTLNNALSEIEKTIKLRGDNAVVQEKFVRQFIPHKDLVKKYWNEALKGITPESIEKYTGSLLRGGPYIETMKKMQESMLFAPVMTDLEWYKTTRQNFLEIEELGIDMWERLGVSAEEFAQRAQKSLMLGFILENIPAVDALDIINAKIQEMESNLGGVVEEVKIINEEMANNEAYEQRKQDMADMLASVQAEIDAIPYINQGYERGLDIVSYYNMALKQAEEELKNITDEVEKKAAAEALANDMLDEYLAKLKELQSIQRGGSINRWIEEAMDLATRFEENVVHALDNLSDRLAEFIETGKMDWKDFTSMMLREFLRTIVKMQVAMATQEIFKPALSALGTGLSSLFGGLGNIGNPATGSGAYGGTGGGGPTGGASRSMIGALGLAFNAGKLIPMAVGGLINSIVTRPTLSPLALMGEAGPEAVMPLTRTSGGELGVRSETKMENKLKIINVMDREQYLAAMQSEPGEKVIMNILRRNGVI